MDIAKTGNVPAIEIMNCIKKAGLEPDEANLTQLWQAVNILSEGNTGPQGPQGIQGVQGPKGDKGEAANPAQGFEQETTSPGWVKFPNGIIMQWGTALSSTDGIGRATFPIPFPNKMLTIQLTDGRAARPVDIINSGVVATPAADNVGFYFAASLNGVGQAETVNWFAIGY